MIKGFVGINLYGDSTEEMVAFYRDKLGVPLHSEGFGGFEGAEVGVKGTQTNLIFWDAPKWNQEIGTVMFVFKCDSLDTAYEELKEKGVELAPPVRASWGGRELYVNDPMGNRILLLENQ
ncbi:VOC family protein [Bacillus cereus]|uniref:VOC family protein n=1 Tax=Bacillus cereus TaxID=1396 RepID=UPI00065C134A|nr:VOC family protein [Bacillus cereus]KMQ32176.1 hypothetical protein TU58_01430 [Bacillus cereus]